MGGKDDLRFRLPARMTRKRGTHFWVRLDANDTYTVEFSRWNPRKFEVERIERAEGVYADMLPKVFEGMTELATRL